MKSVLNYFVRKAFGFKATATAEDKTLFGHLLRIRQNIQGVYDWLYARCPADAWWLARRMPMTEAVTSADGSSGSTPVKLRPVLQNTDTLLAHLRLLDNRKITNGYADGTPADDGLPDGVSLARLLCDSSTQPTELIDDNVGWVMDKALSNILPNLVDVELRCGLITSQIAVSLSTIKRLTLHATEIKYSPSNYRAMIDNLAGLEHIEFPELKTADFGSVGYLYGSCPNVLSLTLPEMESISVCNESCLRSTTLEEFIAPNLSDIKRYNIAIFLNSCTALRKVVVKHAPINRKYPGVGDLDGCPNLIHLEFAEGMDKEIYIPYWIPTNVLSDPEFLSNFQQYIADRVADRTGQSALTLTLSAEVYAALEQQEGQTILATLTNKNWTVASA